MLSTSLKLSVSLFYISVNLSSINLWGGFGLLVGQKKTFENVRLCFMFHCCLKEIIKRYYRVSRSCFLGRGASSCLKYAANIRINYYIFMKYNISLIKL